MLPCVFFVYVCSVGVAQNVVVHGIRDRETPADQRPAGGGHLPIEPGQQGAAAPQLGSVHYVRGGGVRVLDGRGRVHVRGAIHAHRLVRDDRLLATRPPQAQRSPVRDRGVRQAVQVHVPVQPPGERERCVCRHVGHPRRQRCDRVRWLVVALVVRLRRVAVTLQVSALTRTGTRCSVAVIVR